MNRQPRTLLTILLIAAIGGTGFFLWRDLQGPPDSSSSSGASPVRPTRGGRITVTLRAEPRSFNRLVAANAVTDAFTHLTQAKLVRVNRTTRELEPWLAEKWETASDQRTFTLTLREGLTWSDGTPFTTADVLFTFRAVFDERAHSVLASALRSTASRSRSVLRMPAPSGSSTRPPSVRGCGSSTTCQSCRVTSWRGCSTREPLARPGTLPHRRRSWRGWDRSSWPSYEPGQRLTFVRNPRYWRKAGDGTALPYLDEVVLEIVPDQSAELVRLQSGQADMMQQALRSEDLAALRPHIDAGRVSLVELGVSTDPDAFFLNLRERFWSNDPRRGWITRRELRQALSHAVDREAFAESVFLGAAVPVWGPVSPGNTQWFSPNVPRYPYSLEQSRGLLAGLGLTNRDGDEWLEDEHGTEVRFSVLTYRGNQVLERETAFLRDEVRKVGIALDVVAVEQNALVDRMLKGSFEAIYFGYNATDLDPALNRDFWVSSGAAHIWNMAQAKPATAWESEIDGLIAKQTSATDPDERRRLFAEVQRVFGEQVPALYFAAPRLYMGVSTRTVNLAPSVLRPQLLWSADTIAVTP